MMLPMLPDPEEETKEVVPTGGVARMSKSWREKLFVASDRDWNSNDLF